MDKIFIIIIPSSFFSWVYKNFLYFIKFFGKGNFISLKERWFNDYRRNILYIDIQSVKRDFLKEKRKNKTE